MKDECEEVVTLSVRMSDEQILTLIKGACTRSEGKPFQVIQLKARTASYDWSQLKPFECPYYRKLRE